MKLAIISDIHGNLEALEAVLADISSQGVDKIYCLGDTVGYGPNPIECIEKIRSVAALCLLGNHDQAALFDPEGFNSSAERAIFWTREQLENTKIAGANERWDFLNALPRIYRESDVLYVHGSPRNPLNEYVFQDDIYNERKMERIFSIIPRVSFQGHTHVPGVFTDDREFYTPDELNMRYTVTETKAMVNVGSVGQPRDRDNRSCYVIMEGPTITYRRVIYPIEKTIEKILAIPELDNYLGLRLREGK
ncbi:MAG: metallophosphoesterase [Planctomycetaceae bacterium]|nr:metallophosphoesterase [Planctomycetaceae bacterium]